MVLRSGNSLREHRGQSRSFEVDLYRVHRTIQ
jgi:hypothetical protein